MQRRREEEQKRKLNPNLSKRKRKSKKEEKELKFINPNSGHFTNIIKIDGKYFNFDDNRVSPLFVFKKCPKNTLINIRKYDSKKKVCYFNMKSIMEQTFQMIWKK